MLAVTSTYWNCCTLIFPDPRSCHVTHSPPKVLGKCLFLSLAVLVAAGFPWLVAALLQSLPPASDILLMFLCLVSYKGTLSGFRARFTLV